MTSKIQENNELDEQQNRQLTDENGSLKVSQSKNQFHDKEVKDIGGSIHTSYDEGTQDSALSHDIEKGANKLVIHEVSSKGHGMNMTEEEKGDYMEHKIQNEGEDDKEGDYITAFENKNVGGKAVEGECRKRGGGGLVQYRNFSLYSPPFRC